MLGWLRGWSQGRSGDEAEAPVVAMIADQHTPVRPVRVTSEDPPR
jgi:hypothetical protein